MASIMERLDKVFTTERLKKHKYMLRAAFQASAFVLLVGVTLLLNWLSSTDALVTDSFEYGSETEALHRRLQAETMSPAPSPVPCDKDTADPEWLIAFQALGVLYMFLALAIVCDEFFVPALEEMSSKRQLGLSMDVAGATLMAAGGSAPELFSSLFGTFQESEIGFGTIIGSAVFNVLFVIAMCALFSKELLTLTWWPLFRDSFCYAVGLIVLTLFVGFISREEVELWEAIVLFCMYLVYVLIMWKNADLYHYFTGKELELDDEDDEDQTEPELEQQPDSEETNGDVERPTVRKQPSGSSLNSVASLQLLSNPTAIGPGPDMRWAGTFRAGILKLLRDPNTWIETGGVGIVAKIAGDAKHVFKKIDQNGDGHIDREELRRLFQALDASMTPQEFEEVYNQLDTDHDGVIGESEFNQWYTNSKELIRSQVRMVFDKLDTNQSGTLDKYEIKALLVELDPKVSDNDVEDALKNIIEEGSREEITFDEFSHWYQHSIMYERQKKAVEEDMEGVWESLKPPFGGGLFGWVQYIVVFPLVFVTAITIPDVRRPGKSKWCYLSFFLSICWIGGFSYLMVTWAEIIGNTLGIPSVIMGLTVLAAGTSVPDLLSSVIVARRGSGDMAVSSSIGSNIFDILVGLPVPWILYTAWTGSVVEIGTDNIWIYIGALLAMLVFVISTIHFQGWKLTKILAALMLWFYFAFLTMAIILEIPFEICGA